MKVLFFTILLFCLCTISSAQIATYSGISSTNFPATTTQTGVTASNLVAGSGIISVGAADGCNSQPRLYVIDDMWPMSDDQNYALSLNITANIGYTVTITGVSLTQRRTLRGPTDINIQIGNTDNLDLTSTICETPLSVTSSVTLQSGQSSTIIIFLSNQIDAIPIGFFDFNDIQIMGNVILPVEFLSFDVTKKDHSSNILFSTASETNNDYFTIERSTDSRDFEAIGEIKGAGNSTEQITYTFTDENPLSGTNYYRIKQTDFDGKYSYSDVKAVNHQGNIKSHISPKITNELLAITTQLENYDVFVHTSVGQVIAHYTGSIGNQNIDISQLTTGIYYLVIRSRESQETFKFVKY